MEVERRRLLTLLRDSVFVDLDRLVSHVRPVSRPTYLSLHLLLCLLQRKLSLFLPPRLPQLRVVQSPFKLLSSLLSPLQLPRPPLGLELHLKLLLPFVDASLDLLSLSSFDSGMSSYATSPVSEGVPHGSTVLG